MAREGGRVQLEQSDMRLALNMAKMAQERFSRAAIDETEQLISKPHAEVRDEKKRAVVFPGHNTVKAVIERPPSMVRENQMDGCIPCQNGTAMNPPTHCRCKGSGALPPHPAPPRPGTAPAPPDDTERTVSPETEGEPPGYVYIHTPLPCTRVFNLDPYAKNRVRDKDFIPE